MLSSRLENNVTLSLVHVCLDKRETKKKKQLENIVQICDIRFKEFFRKFYHNLNSPFTLVETSDVDGAEVGFFLHVV